MSSIFPLDFNFAFGSPATHGDFRCQPADFNVQENLGFSLAGEGEHLFLHIEKIGQNTEWLAQQIAAFAGVNKVDVGYSGRKDRHAVTTQWFSIYAPKLAELNWSEFTLPGVKVLSVNRHTHKLKPGHHQTNTFAIVIRNLSQTQKLNEKLHLVKQGVPNYFGEQRFGQGGNNLNQFQSWVEKQNHTKKNKHNRKLPGMILSAARSYLFNLVLSQRVKDQTWNQLMPGDVNEVDATGPLWGRGRPLVSDATAELEATCLDDWQQWRDALEHMGLTMERRPLKCVPQNFQSTVNGNTLNVEFTLSAGQFATSVLREIAILSNRSTQNFQSD